MSAPEVARRANTVGGSYEIEINNGRKLGEYAVLRER